MVKKLVALMLFTLTFSFRAQALNAWVGVAGPGNGAGSFGHTFLVFSKGSPHLGKVVSYGVEQNNISGFMDHVGLATGLGDKKMLVMATDFTEFSYLYRILENRKITLFRLRLSDAEVSRLWSLTQDDLASQAGNNSQLKYSLTSSNCLTRIIQLLNKIVSSERRIPIEAFSESLQPGFDTPEQVATNFLNRVPVWMGKYLPTAPIYGGKTIKIDDFNSYRIKATSIGLRDLFSKIRSCNVVSKDMSAAIKDMTLFAQRNQPYFEKYMFDRYFKKLKPCDNTDSFYKAFLLVFYNGVNPLENEYRQKLSVLISEES